MSEDNLRKWAAKNAYTLTFCAAMFVVTWVIQVLVAYVF